VLTLQPQKGDHTMKTRNMMRTRSAILAGLCLFFFTFAVQPLPVHAADAVTDANVASKIEQAKTTADYEALAAYFKQEAVQAGETVTLHEQMLASVKKTAAGRSSRHHVHCRTLIRSAKADQDAYQALADQYAEMATEAGK
jgi:hypothetical protein